MTKKLNWIRGGILNFGEENEIFRKPYIMSKRF
jgi:hypothetical protein